MEEDTSLFLSPPASFLHSKEEVNTFKLKAGSNPALSGHSSATFPEDIAEAVEVNGLLMNFAIYLCFALA